MNEKQRKKLAATLSFGKKQKVESNIECVHKFEPPYFGALQWIYMCDAA